MSRLNLKGVGKLVKQTGLSLFDDKLLKLSASLAYYTVFSLGPMLLIIIFLSSLFWGDEAIRGAVFLQTRKLIGNEAALQIQEIIKNAAIKGNNTLTAVVGIITLFIGATSVFVEIQDSINAIWQLKPKPKKGFILFLKSRLLSFSLVISLGFLLLVSLVFNGAVEGLVERLKTFFPDITLVMIYIINLLVTLLLTTALFSIIFKVLPDATIRWKDVIAGAFFTAILFMIGKLGITLYITNSDIGSSYGAAGSLVILLIWVYYSAVILYLGAEFTKFYAFTYGEEIKPDKYAVFVHREEVEKEHTGPENKTP
jgi:membrane protein